MISALCLAIALLAGPGTSPAEIDAAPGPLGTWTFRTRLDPTPWAIPFPEQATPQEKDEEFYRKSWRKHGAFSELGYLFAGLLVRETMLRGDWYDDGLEDDDYGDLFKPGTGLVVELGGMIPYREDWRVGLYLSGGWDTYEGDSIEVSPGNDLEPDEMVIFTGLLGFRGMLHFAEFFFLEAHVAGGVVYYEAVDYTMGAAEGELFASSVNAAGEAGVRFGIELVYIQFEIGIGYRIQGGPDRGEDAQDADPELMHCVFVELGGALRF